MGCNVSKTVPDDPTATRVVVQVFEQNERNKENSRQNPHQKHSHARNNRDQPKDPRASGPPADGQRSNRKVKKYRDKFDARVTAKYDIKALIGRGNFSKVVRVEHRVTRQPYAIKMIDRVQGKEVFEAEVAVLRRVKHSHIIQLIEVFETKDKVYMVMELATGGELFDRIIAKGSFTERDATHVLNMVLDGVKYLHGLGITHRDLKPENLLYYHPGHDSKIMITDFGLSATKKGPDNFMRTTCGTPEYIAPEIIARKPYTCQVDMWAVGVITYILLSGTMPFDDENKTRLYRLILKAKYSYAGEHWKDVSAAAKDFIDKLLIVDPNVRIGANQSMNHTWLVTNAASSSNKNLHRTISQNLIHRQSIRANSTKSAKSTRSTKSNKSNRSGRSLRSEHRRVQPEEIDELHRDPDVQADLASLG
ncbi:serine/threonine-protein kinase H1 homolog [Ylistrum balloti]|uniref:serine/threonine-protein kinase H1 homolog n=1 Tax=Ylistrum balloti TaxID=509963 RepID=UPI002905EB22|nr:serine/threonine-protein kinase H1 homolog [Ylistrum balloti]